MIGNLVVSTWASDQGLVLGQRAVDGAPNEITAARRLALLRKIALHRVARGRTSRPGLRGRRKRAAWNDDDMLRFIAAIPITGTERRAPGLAGRPARP